MESTKRNFTLSQHMTAYTTCVTAALQNLPMVELEKVVLRLNEARTKRQRVFTCGNGGSAATSIHFAADLEKGAMTNGHPIIDSECLCDNMARFSAWANDTSFAEVFVGAIKSKIRQGCVLIAISGSGNSPNVLRAVQTARSLGATTIGLTGFDGGRLKDLVDICVTVPSCSMEQIEDVHLILCHLFTSCLRNLAAADL